MTEISTLVDVVQAGGFVGLLIILAFPRLRKIVGFDNNGNDTTKIIEEIRKEFSYNDGDRPALIARIPLICKDIREIKEDISWVKGKLDN